MLTRAALCFFLISCTSSTFSTTLTALSATDALVGSDGLLRITRANAGTSAEVKLAVSDPNIAAIAGSVVMQDGETVVEVPWQGKASGTVVFTATIGTSTQTQFAQVVSGAFVSDFFIDDRVLQVGASTLLEVSLSLTPAKNQEITCSSSDEAVAKVPASIVVPSWSSYGDAALTAVGAGVARIACTYDGVEYAGTVSVVESLTLKVDGNAVRRQKGTTLMFDVQFDAVPAADETVLITSSAPDVVAAPAQAIVRGGDDYTTVSLSVLAAGTSIITFTYGEQQNTVSVTGVDQIGLADAFFSPSRVVVGTPVSLSLEVDTPPAQVSLVTLASSNAAVLAAPASVAVPPGEFNVSTAFVPKTAGDVSVTASIGGSTRTATLGVVSQASVFRITGDDVGKAGVPQELLVTLDSTSSTDTQVALSSNDPALLTVPASITVPAGVQYASFFATPLASGTAIVTATLNGTSASFSVAITAETGVNVSLGGDGTVQGGFVSLFASVSVPTLTATVVTLSSSNPSVLTVPASVTIDAGEYATVASLIAGVPGVTVVTATFGGVSVHRKFEVVAAPALGSLLGVRALKWGAVTSMSTLFSAPLQKDALVTVSVADPTVIEVLQNPVHARAGDTSVTVFFRAKAKSGTSDVLLRLGNGTSATSLTSVELPVLELTGQAPKVGGYTPLRIEADCVLAAPITVTFVSSNPAAFTIDPPTVTLTSTDGALTTLFGVSGGTGVVTVTGVTGVTLPAPLPMTIQP